MFFTKQQHSTKQKDKRMDPVQELLQVADTLLQMADHIQRKRKMDTLVLESNTEFKRLQNLMYKSKRPMRRKMAAAAAEASPKPTATASHVPTAAPPPKLVAVPIDEWEKICLYSSKMVHLIYHQKNLLQTFLPGHSDADIIVQAMSGCTCLKKAC